MNSSKETFTQIYETRAWGQGEESLSGAGSSLEYTANLRNQLPLLFEKFSIRSVFDAPCGDFHWMSHVMEGLDGVRYIGGDLVNQLIEQNNVNFLYSSAKFVNFDITRNVFPKTDLWMCRDCWFHLTIEDIYKSLQLYIWSGIPYLLTSTHINSGEFANVDLSASGGFRKIDLFSAPFLFPQDPLFRIEDSITGFPRREMCLWSREQIIAATIGDV